MDEGCGPHRPSRTTGVSARVEIHTDALLHNLARVRSLAPGCKVMAVVKANAYGHRLEKIGPALKQVDGFAVARLDEALVLRQCGWRGCILLLEGFLQLPELEIAVRHELSLVVHEPGQLATLGEFASRQARGRLEVWLKIDTGMNRLGFRCEDAVPAYQSLADCRCVAGIQLMTHLACADELDHPAVTRAQLARFDALDLPADLPRSAANSAAILNWPRAHYQWVRPGIMLYGVSPLAGSHGAQLGLQAAMTLYTQLIAVKPVKAGESVGYSGVFVAPEDLLLGIAAIGYGDGYPWQAPNGTPVWVNGKRVALSGRVSMDMIALDLSACDNPAPGDRVVLWGPELPVEVVSEHIGVTPYELVTRLTRRVGVS